jgi:hypothetical protein
MRRVSGRRAAPLLNGGRGLSSVGHDRPSAVRGPERCAGAKVVDGDSRGAPVRNRVRAGGLVPEYSPTLWRDLRERFGRRRRM